MSSIGKKIKDIRNNYKLTQKKFGELIGVSDAHVSKMESGKDYPSHALIQVICSKFRVNERWLREPDYNPNHKPDFRIIKTDEDIKKRMSDLLEDLGLNDKNYADFMKDLGLRDEKTTVVFDISKAKWMIRELADINIIDLIGFSEYFNVSLDWLIKGSEYSAIHSSDLSNDEANLLKGYRELADDEKELALNLIEKFAKK